jgi:hypothetical protein
MKQVILFLFFCQALTAFGQEKMLSKIKLKNGSKIKAEIIENRPGEFVQIKLTAEQLTTINYADIISIHNTHYQYDSDFELKEGLSFEGSYAFMFGKSGSFDELRVGMSLGVVGSYRFKPYFSVGAGVELNALYVNSDYLLFPIFGRISGSFSEKKVTPYYILDLGWSSASSGNDLGEDFDMQGGYLFRPEIGVRINQVRIGVGLQNQMVRTRYTTNLWWGDEQVVEEERMLRNIRIGVSVIF